MERKKIIQRIRYYTQFLPITFNGLMLGLVLWFCFWLLKPEANPDEEVVSSFLPFLRLMSKTALLFFCAFILLSFLSTLFCWIYYLWLSRQEVRRIQFQFQPNEKINKHIFLSAKIEKARRPFLGFIKSSLVYDDFQLTEKITLAGNLQKEKGFWRKSVTTSSKLNLPDIKTYSLKGSFVYFEDMLQLFSFTVYQEQKGNFFQAPQKINLEPQNAKARQTEQADIRIEESRRIPGDYLNYKNFESGDDIRRIVWKVYAKNRELVVRTPEQRDLYASHIYFYASFFANVPEIQQHSAFGKEMLNYFKNSVWSIYDALSHKENLIKYIPDQELNLNPQDSAALMVQNIISNSGWQKEKPINDYFKTATGSVLCISSFNDPVDIQEIVEKCSRETVIYYVKLSKAFQHHAALSWVAKLFFQSSDDRLKNIRGLWLFHPFRIQLLKREKEIEQILEQSNVSIGKI